VAYTVSFDLLFFEKNKNHLPRGTYVLSTFFLKKQKLPYAYYTTGRFKKKHNSLKMKKLLVLGLLTSLLVACHKHEYYQTNPNQPSTATPALLLTGICVDVFNTYPTSPAYAARYVTYYERPDDNVNYGWQTAGFGGYSTLRQVNQMQQLAQVSGEEHYVALAKFFRAVIFSRLTETFGDVPYSQALQGLQGNNMPTYDTQESIYAGILQELEEANTLLTGSNADLVGDVIYDGDASKWQRAVNAFRLRLLLHLSRRADDSSINVRGQFAQIVGDPTKYPLFRDAFDNAQIQYDSSAVASYYPLFNNLSVKSLVSLEKGLVDLLKVRQDPRLFQFGDPISGQSANVFDSYAGVDAGLLTTDQQNAAPLASKIHRRYVQNKINEPMTLIGYSEQEFLVAEGKARGWASGDPTGHYNNGVRASMRTYGIGSLTIEQYLARPLVKYNTTDGLAQIATQKYLALFMQSGWEPFLEQRRTGVPAFSIGPGTLNNGQIPKRWKYPQDERETNQANVDAAVARQYGGTDDVNQVMWILK
jgi:hypothetical protein